MAYSMVALTTAGTTFACASVSLTETGLAVLDESGSRIGFVPYDSLEYVAPTEASRVSDAPMRVLTADGSTFGAASISQAAAGVAVLDESGARIGFVPYDTLTYVLPEAKTGPTLPADTTPVDGVDVEGEDTGGSPVWEDGDDGAEGEEEADDGETDDAADDGEDDETEDEESVGEDDGAASDEDDGEGDRTVWGGESAETSERDGGADESGTNDDAGPDDQQRTNGEHEEAEESELVVEWSFGDGA